MAEQCSVKAQKMKEVMMTKKATHGESEKRVHELEQETFSREGI